MTERIIKTLVQRLAAEEEMDYSDAIETQFGPAMTLFQAIVNRIAATCDEEGAEFLLALLAGRSFLERPGSLSAQYQEIVRTQIVAWAEARDLPVIDVANAMRHRAQGTSTGWYFKNEGHLTPAGHRVAAEILLPTILECAALRSTPTR